MESCLSNDSNIEIVLLNFPIVIIAMGKTVNSYCSDPMTSYQANEATEQVFLRQGNCYSNIDIAKMSRQRIGMGLCVINDYCRDKSVEDILISKAAMVDNFPNDWYTDKDMLDLSMSKIGKGFRRLVDCY